MAPLSDGSFFTDAIPLSGRICGISGDYEIKLFYGDYKTTAEFSVTDTIYSKPSIDDQINTAQELISNQIQIIDNKFGIDESFTDRLNTSVESKNLSELEDLYVDLWNEFFVEDFLFEIDPAIRLPIESSLDSISKPLDSNELSFEVTKFIETSIASSVFYYGVGDSKKSIDVLSDVFISIKNANPEKIEAKRAPIFDELKTFMEEFGGDNYKNNPCFSSVLNYIQISLANLNAENVDEKLEELKRIIERYLSIRSRSAVIEAEYDNDKLFVSDSVQKTLAFRDLFVDVFDQRGNLVYEISLKDNSSGLFNEVVSKSFSPGVMLHNFNTMMLL